MPVPNKPNQNNINTILSTARWYGLSLEQTAYLLGTTEHETKGTYEAVEEAFYTPNPEANQKLLPYYPYIGRGFVQTTHDYNYKKVDDTFGTQTVKSPKDMNADPLLAALTMVHGTKEGWYGRKLDEFINSKNKDYTGARQAVNDTDRADLVSKYANSWEMRLKKEGWINGKDGSITNGKLKPDEEIFERRMIGLEIMQKYPKFWNEQKRYVPKDAPIELKYPNINESIKMPESMKLEESPL